MTMSSTTLAAAAATISAAPVAEEEEYYSSWSLFLVCMLLILSLLTSYYLQIKRIRAVHETLVSIVAGMFVGLIIRLAPGTMIREMLVSLCSLWSRRFRACTCPLARDYSRDVDMCFLWHCCRTEHEHEADHPC
jgi:phosphatidylserine synthase